MPKEDIVLSDKEQRRNRIKRIKNGIIITVAGWIIISMIAIIGLIVHLAIINSRQHKMLDQIKELKRLSSKTTVEDLEKYANVEVGLDTPDNMFVTGDSRKVYLTFDSVAGENTNKILDVLKEYDVKATFFVSGDESETAQAVYKRIVDEGHTLAMHSYSNQYSALYASTDAFYEDTVKLQDFLESVTGVKSVYYRFPGGSFNEISNINMAEFVHVLNENEITYFDWNVTAGDASSDYTTESVVSNVTNGVANYKTSVVLLHDSSSKEKTVEALDDLIKSLQNMGVELLPIDESTYVVQYMKANTVE